MRNQNQKSNKVIVSAHCYCEILSSSNRQIEVQNSFFKTQDSFLLLRRSSLCSFFVEDLYRQRNF